MPTHPISAPVFNLAEVQRDHIATRCVCCGNVHLKSSPAVLMPFVAHRALGWKPVVIDESWGLATIPKGNALSICNSLYCPECGLVFLDIRFSNNELDNLYRDYRGADYTALRDYYEPGYAKRNALLDSGAPHIAANEAFLKPHLTFPLRILDWGGDTGRNTPFKDCNEVFDIYDISGKPVIDGARSVSHLTALGTDYNLIVCNAVLEHVPYPSDVLNDIKRVMRKDTILYVELPFEDLMLSEEDLPHLRKRHWHEHVNFFSQHSLKRLLGGCGLTILAIDRHRLEVGGKPLHVFQVACILA